MFLQNICLIIAFIEVTQRQYVIEAIDPGTFVGRKLIVPPLGRGQSVDSNMSNNSEQVTFDIPEHEIILRRLNIFLNYTASSEKKIFARAESSGTFYLFIGNEIQRIFVHHDVLHLSRLAIIDDVDEVDEFEIEEIHTHSNKTCLIVCIHRKDRFQIYQILPGITQDSEAIKSIQKIRRRGLSIKTLLVEYMSDLFLISSYLESNAGKVAIYRWLNFHFSLEDIKDVPKHDKVIVHSNKQLVILLLNLAVYPERSINNIYVLNENRKLVKTQEMFFLFNRLPYYRVNNDLYILRCLAIDKCFLYKWNGESLFIRVSKIDLDPRDINLFDSRYNILVMSSNSMLYIYFNQPLLKATASYVLIDNVGKFANVFQIGAETRHIYTYNESNTGKLYLCILYRMDEMEFIELQPKKQREADVPKGDQASFNALSTCIINIKRTLNVRKIWTDLMKYHVLKVLNVCRNPVSSRLIFIGNIFAANTNAIKKMFVNGLLENSPSVIYHKWKALRETNYLTLARSKNLLYLNRINRIKSDFKIIGNLCTNKAGLNRITIRRSESLTSHKRNKRHNRFRQSLAKNTLNVKELKFNGIFFVDMLSKSGSNYVLLYGLVKNLKVLSVTFETGRINGVKIGQALFNATYENILIVGRKTFQTIDTKSIRTFSVNDHLSRQQFTKMRSITGNKTRSNTIVQLAGTRKATILKVSRKMNNVLLYSLLEELYYTNDRRVIAGNIQLQSRCQIRNVHSYFMNHIMSKIFFDLKTNQTVSSSMHLLRVYVIGLHNQVINGIHIAKDIALGKETKFIRKALASNFIVMNDLSLSAVAKNITQHVLGTNIKDFLHIYNGRVLIKGSLKLNELNTVSHNYQIHIKDLIASSSIIDRFWMKHVEQNVMNLVHKRHVQSTQLLCVDLNYNTADAHLRNDNWHLNIIADFSKVHMLGNMLSLPTVKTLWGNIDSGIVRRESISKVFGCKLFISSMNVDILIADSVDSIQTQNLMPHGGAEISGIKHIGYLGINVCTVRLLGTFYIEYLHNRFIRDIIDQCINSRDIRKIRKIRSLDSTTKLLNAHLINGLNAKQMIIEANYSNTSIEKNDKSFRMDNLVIDDNIIITNYFVVEYLNLINIKEYLKLLALKHQHMQKNCEIGGSKLFRLDSAIDGYFFNTKFNQIIMDDFLHIAVRLSIQQNVIDSWFFDSIKTGSVTSKIVNDILINEILDTNLQAYRIQWDLTVKNLLISSNSRGIIRTNSSDIQSPINTERISILIVHGAFLQQHNGKTTFLFDLAKSGVTNDCNEIEKRIILHGGFNYIRIVNSETKLNKTCSLIGIIEDAVKLNQRSVTFTGIRRVYHNVISEEIALSMKSMSTPIINGVYLNRLDRSIHGTLQDQFIISTKKHFETDLLSIRMITHEEYLTNLHLSNKIMLEDIQYHLEAPVTVAANMFVHFVNNYSLGKFLTSRIIKNRIVSSDYQHTLQQITGYTTFSTLALRTNKNIIQTLNRVLVSEIITETSIDHQNIPEMKSILGNLFSIGPASIIRCNRYALLDTYDSSYLLNDKELHPENIVFSEKSKIHYGFFARYLLNNNSVQVTMEPRLLSVEKLFPLIPPIREGLLTSHGAFQNAVTRMPYIENTIVHKGNIFVRNTVQRDFFESNLSEAINIKEVYNNGGEQLNLTVHFELRQSEWKSVSSLIDGHFVQVDWIEITHNEMKQLLVLLLIMKHNLHILNLHAYRADGLIEWQEIAVLPSPFKFKLLQSNSTSAFVILSEPIEMTPALVAYNLQLFCYDAEVMRFMHSRTTRDYFNAVAVVVLNEKVMLMGSNPNSNALIVMELADNVLYQKIVFDSNIASIEVLYLEDSPTLKVSLINTIVYIYVHIPLVGWKYISSGRE